MAMSELRIEAMEREHLEGCAAIVGALELFESYGFTPETALRLLTRALDESWADLRVALDGDRVAGFAWFVPRGAFDRSGYLRLIAVDPAYQGQGVGQLLLGELERAHLQEGGIVLLASATNEAAHRFYERLGYRIVGTMPDYVRPGLDERVFFKPPSRG